MIEATREPKAEAVRAGRRPDVVRTVAELRERVGAWRMAGDRIAMVPTMGALHDGHLSLVEDGQRRAAHVVVSIFVNPTQFAPHEDFQTYPRTEEADLDKLARLGTDLVFAPPAVEMYPGGSVTRIEMAGPALGLETDFRPHFFGGVATVVSKLLIACAPDVAVFGEKDYQQLAVIRQMVADLLLPVEIVGGATVREADGLAMSSRNAYLTDEERSVAPRLYAEMTELADRVRAGGDIATAIDTARAAILAAGFRQFDYLAVRNAVTLAAPSEPGEPLRLLAAAWLGRTRLIDNIAI